MTSFYPATVGRVTNHQSISRLLFQINHDQGAIQSLQSQLSTGRRITSPSEDPAAAIRALTAQRQLEFKSQTDDNLRSADTILSATESVLAQAQGILHEMRGVSVAAASNLITDDERTAFIAQISAAISKLTDIGNSKFRDQFIFSGSDVHDAPFNFGTDSVRFTGNEEDLQTISDFASTVAANISAEDAFGVRSDRVVSSIDLNPAISPSVPLADLNSGDGVQLGAISFSDGVEVVELDLAGAYDVAEILDRINATTVSGRELTATLSASGINIDYLDGLGGLLRVDEVASGNAANSLGILSSGAISFSPVFGDDLNPVATPETELSRLFFGSGITAGDSMRLQQGENTYIIDTTGMETIEDFISGIHQSGAQVVAALDPTGRYLSIQTTESGTRLTIGDNGGTLATRLGLRTLDASTPLSELNAGQGIYENDVTGENDIVLVRSDGTEFTVDLRNVSTVGDVLNRINSNVDNFDPGLRIVASLSADGEGIVLTAPAGTQNIEVRNFRSSQTGWGLGLISLDQTSTVGSNLAGSSVITGIDVSGVEVEGVFNSLISMRRVIESEKPEDMVRVAAMIEQDIERMAVARGLIGERQQSIAQSVDLSAEQQLQLKEIESNELDADLASVISELAAREAALQASLQLMGQTSRLSLFDYL